MNLLNILISIPPPHIRKFRQRLLLEELTELKEAYRQKDRIRVADGIGDVLYVDYGTAIAYGVVLTPYISDIASTAQWPFEQLSHFVISELLDIAEGSTVFATTEKNRVISVIEHLEILQCSMYRIGRLFNFDVNAIFAEIHRSNMTKEKDNLREDGKLLKGKSFIPPDLGPIINK